MTIIGYCSLFVMYTTSNLLSINDILELKGDIFENVHGSWNHFIKICIESPETAFSPSKAVISFYLVLQ